MYPQPGREQRSAEELWRLLWEHIEQVPEAVLGTPEAARAHASALTSWFADVSHFRKGLLAEAEYERETLSDAEEDDLPYEKPAPAAASEPVAAAASAKREARRALKQHALKNKIDEELDDAAVARFRRSFDLFDADGDGTISATELRNVLRSLGRAPTQEQLDQILKVFDADGSGRLEFEEFVTLIRTELSHTDRNDVVIDAAWRAIDANKSGFVSPAELRRVMSNLVSYVSDAEIAAMVTVADAEGDGQLSLAEFRVHLHKVAGLQDARDGQAGRRKRHHGRSSRKRKAVQRANSKAEPKTRALERTVEEAVEADPGQPRQERPRRTRARRERG
jgi:Ca2+-binding EF-hand superfamily protein